MRLASILAIIFLAISVNAQLRGRAARTAPTQWTAPQCSTVSGLPGFYFTFDESHTVSANAAPDPENAPVFVAITDVPNRIFSLLAGGLYESDDAGCTWRLRDHISDAFTGIVAARGSRAYAWSQTQPLLLRVTASTNDTVGAPEPLLKLAADGAHLVGVGKAAVHESLDAGASWSDIGQLPAGTSTVAIDPHDLLHIAAGYRGGGAVSGDGGKTWQPSNTSGADAVSLAFAPSNSSVVWLMSLITEPHANGLHRSADGGKSFPLVARSSPSSTGLHFQTSALFPNPTDDEIIAVQSYIDGLTIIDARTGTMRSGHYHYWDSAIWSLTPGVMYMTTHIFVAQQVSK